MTAQRPHNAIYDEDKLAGLGFETERGWCLFRTDCGFVFNYPLDVNEAYAVIHPETHELVGIYSPTEFTGPLIPTSFYQVYLLHPLLQKL